MSALVGEVALEFNLPDTDGRSRWLREFHRLGPVVVLFLPTVYGYRPRWQLWSFLRHYDQFIRLSTEVVVVSGDSLPELRIFQIRRGFPFVFLADYNCSVAQSYEVMAGCSGTLLVTTQGVIRHHRVARMGCRSSATSLLRALHSLDLDDRLAS